MMVVVVAVVAAVAANPAKVLPAAAMAPVKTVPVPVMPVIVDLIALSQIHPVSGLIAVMELVMLGPVFATRVGQEQIVL